MIAKQLKYLYRMRKNQWEPNSTLRKLQTDKLRKLIDHAYAHVPFYKQLFDSYRIKPNDIRQLEDLTRIPVSTKKHIQDAPLNSITSQIHRRSRCVRITTSGSSGTPLELFYEKSDFSCLNMNWLRPLLAHDVKPWYRKMEITGPHNISTSKGWYNYLGLWKSQAISVFESPQDWLDLLIAYKPDILYGYSGSLKLLAQHIKKHGFPHPNPRFIFGVSDLVDQECRELVSETFQKKLIDLYGSAEAGCIAWECPECEGYHINIDTVIVEFLNSQESNSIENQGRVIITNLYSYAMPIIRYDLGDIGALSDKKSTCGRELPLMRVIEGRADSFVILPSGIRLSPMFFFGIMKPIEGISQWRIHQDLTSSISVLVVPSKEISPQTILLIKKRIVENISEELTVEIKVVDNIPPDQSGKLRAVISKV
jgi:phenylacetate-CoA ligase